MVFLIFVFVIFLKFVYILTLSLIQKKKKQQQVPCGSVNDESTLRHVTYIFIIFKASGFIEFVGFVCIWVRMYMAEKWQENEMQCNADIYVLIFERLDGLELPIRTSLKFFITTSNYVVKENISNAGST